MLNGVFYHVLISSPDDIESERVKIPEWIQIWNQDNYRQKRVVLVPLKWEQDAISEMGVDAQISINGQLVDQSDIIIGLFWTKLGTETERSQSGSVEEVERGVNQGKKVQVYFSKQKPEIEKIDPQQFQRLKAFKELCKTRGFYQEYSDEGELQRKIYQSLSHIVDKLQEKQSVSEFRSDKTGELNRHEMAALSVLLGKGVNDVEGTSGHAFAEEMENNGFNAVASRMSIESLLKMGFVFREEDKSDFNYTGYSYSVTGKGIDWALDHQEAFDLEIKSRSVKKMPSFSLTDAEFDKASDLDDDPF